MPDRRPHGADKHLVLALVVLLLTVSCAVPFGLYWHRVPHPPKADPGLLGLGTEETARKFALYHAKRGTTHGGPLDRVEIHSVSRNKHGWWIVRGERWHLDDDGNRVHQGIRIRFCCDPAWGLYRKMGGAIYTPGSEPPLPDCVSRPPPPPPPPPSAGTGSGRGGRP